MIKKISELIGYKRKSIVGKCRYIRPIRVYRYNKDPLKLDSGDVTYNILVFGKRYSCKPNTTKVYSNNHSYEELLSVNSPCGKARYFIGPISEINGRRIKRISDCS